MLNKLTLTYNVFLELWIELEHFLLLYSRRVKACSWSRLSVWITQKEEYWDSLFAKHKPYFSRQTVTSRNTNLRCKSNIQVLNIQPWRKINPTKHGINPLWDSTGRGGVLWRKLCGQGLWYTFVKIYDTLSSCSQFPKIAIDNPMLAVSFKREEPIQLHSWAQNHIYAEFDAKEKLIL